MTWIGWMVLIWAAAMLTGFALVGYWIGLNRGARRSTRRAVPTGCPQIGCELREVEHKHLYFPEPAGPVTAPLAGQLPVLGEVIEMPRGPRHASHATVGITTITEQVAAQRGQRLDGWV